MLPADLTGIGKWELIYSINIPATPPFSINPIDIPVLASSRYLVVGASSTDAKPSWYTAGYLYQVLQNINIDDTVVLPDLHTSTNTADGAIRRIALNSIQLVVFPNIAETYGLFFSPVKWLRSLNLFLWQFTGTEINQLDLLTQINNKLP